ncbi:MAG TPA: DUF4270 domain-containing protein [Flavobacterium sp.]
MLTLISCDKDFNEIGSDVIGDDNFPLLVDDTYPVVANNHATGAVQSNNLDVNPLGILDNPLFGKTTANFVTQLELADDNPTFTNVNNPPSVDSVILHVPYFSHSTGTNDNGGRTYELDSVFGVSNSRMKLSISRSGYFLRDLDHNPETGAFEPQRYYSDQNASFDVPVSPVLNDTTDITENNMFFFNNKETVEVTTASNGNEVKTRTVPSMRLHLNREYFRTNIINAPAGALTSNSAFKNYFRGLYFKMENVSGHAGELAMLNFKAGKVTIYYKQDLETTVEGVTTVSRVPKKLVLNMSGNTVSLLQNQNESANYLTAINQPLNPNGVERIYLHGGQGSVATINLFGEDTDGDGVPEKLEELRAKKWLLNEANLTFYIDQSTVEANAVSEPQRIYLYDVKNKMPLVDYIFDNSTAGGNSKKNKGIHDGMLQKQPGENGKGIKYRIRITNYISDLINADSTNVVLGLSLTESIGVSSMMKLRNENSILNNFIPTASVMNPLGIVLYGNTYTANPDKRLKLEIYYTELDNESN